MKCENCNKEAIPNLSMDGKKLCEKCFDKEMLKDEKIN